MAAAPVESAVLAGSGGSKDRSVDQKLAAAQGNGVDFGGLVVAGSQLEIARGGSSDDRGSSAADRQEVVEAQRACTVIAKDQAAAGNIQHARPAAAIANSKGQVSNLAIQVLHRASLEYQGAVVNDPVSMGVIVIGSLGYGSSIGQRG